MRIGEHNTIESGDAVSPRQDILRGLLKMYEQQLEEMSGRNRKYVHCKASALKHKPGEVEIRVRDSYITTNLYSVHGVG